MPRLFRSKDQVLEFSGRNMSEADDTLKRFAAHLQDPAKNPTLAMQWAGSAFTAAAQLHVWAQIKDTVLNARPEYTDEQVHDFLVNMAQEQAMRVEDWSSNPTSNLMATEIRKCWVRVHSFLTKIL